ncbi:Uncharacterised protein [Vibrio cholerae]|nr:Uncharacterised protein [Vibrio cholerae]
MHAIDKTLRHPLRKQFARFKSVLPWRNSKIVRGKNGYC